MKGILLTHVGMEDIAAKEVAGLISQKSSIDEGCITFPCKSDEDLFLLCYRAQSAGKVGFLALDFPYSDLISDFKQAVGSVPWQAFFRENETIRVRCKIVAQKDLPSPEYEQQLSAVLIEHIEKTNKNKQLVDLKNPHVPLIFYVTPTFCYVFIDYAGFDLSKRSHHIFSHAADIKGTLGFGLAMLCDLKEKDVFMDCFAGSGTIPIEAAIYSTHFPLNFFNREKFAFLKFAKYKDHDFNTFFEKENKKFKDSKNEIYCADSAMKHIAFAKKNAQIAGIMKSIDFRRMDLDWLDTKFDKETIDKMASKLPLGKEGYEKHYKQLFYQAEFVLKKNGLLVLIGLKDLIEKYAAEFKLEIREHRNIYSGQEKYDVFVIEKVHAYKKKEQKD